LILVQALAALLLAALVQVVGVQATTLFPRLLDPFLIATVWLALRTGPIGGQLSGLAAGLCHDGLTGGLFGLTSLANTVVGYFISLVSNQVVQQQGIKVLLYGLGSLVQQLVLMLVVALLVPAPELTQAGWMLGRVAVSTLAGALLVGLEISTQQRWGAWRRSRSRRLRFR
jgi:rod shape-determining protein MreD